MKIAVRSHEPTNSVDGYGGLEQRLGVMWGYFLTRRGHDVHYYHERVGCDDSFDLAIDCPCEPDRSCGGTSPEIQALHHNVPLIKAEKHIHSSYGIGPITHPEVTSSRCYQEGKYVLGVPHREQYTAGLSTISQGRTKAQVLFLPLPYPDELMPQGLEKGFNRNGIWWGNKGNFDPVVGPDHHAYEAFMVNGIETLKALIKLNQKVNFDITFLLTARTKAAAAAWPALQIEELISQLKSVRRLETIPWSQLVQEIGKCKLNTHPAGLTSSIHETIFTHGVPVTPRGSAHMFLKSPGVDLIKDRQGVTADEIYDVYERLWFDEKFYTQVYEIYQESFEDHRSANVEKYWKRALDFLELSENI